MPENNNENRPNWFLAHPKLSKVVLLTIVLLIIEIFLRVFVWFGLIPYQTYPTTQKPVYWDDINPHFGVWHYKNASFQHKSICFDVLYTSNSYGARDREHPKLAHGEKRVIVLGDSYAEGYGVEMEKRFSNLLENITGYPFLNFGTSGSFGSIQQWMLYKNLAMQFEHDVVIIFHLPFNDFSDNNPNDFPRNRFRPYLKKKENSYELYYPVEFEKRGREFRKPFKVIKNTIDNNIYIANFLRWVTRVVMKKAGLKKPKPRTPSYEAYNKEDMNILLYSYEQIIKLAGTRRIIIFSIPAYDDFKAAKKGRREFPLHRDLNAFVQKFENVSYVDLLSFLLKYTKEHEIDYDALTLGCDSHWGDIGHQIIAEAVAENFYKNNVFEK